MFIDVTKRLIDTFIIPNFTDAIIARSERFQSTIVSDRAVYVHNSRKTALRNGILRSPSQTAFRRLITFILFHDSYRVFL